MIKLFYNILIVSSAISFMTTTANSGIINVFCYYDSRTYYREHQANLKPEDLDPAMSYCTHLIYGYATISTHDYKMMPFDPTLEMDHGSVGGGADKEDPQKYNKLLESTERRNSFINSAKILLKNHNFDGIDLAWQFPVIKPKKIRTAIGSLWHGIKKTIGGTKLVDDKSEEHKEQFSNLVMEMKHALKDDDYVLTASVLPNVNSSLYFDSYSLKDNLDFIIIHGFDYYTPDRNPKEADFAAPLHELHKRNPKLNIDSVVTHWLVSSFPPEKILLGIPAYGRAWKMTSYSDVSGVPPICIDGPAPRGPYTKESGLLSYLEICTKFLGHENNTQVDSQYYLKKIPDLTNRHGIYAFRLPDKRDERGIWISFEDSESIQNKALYVKKKDLGGIAIIDLTLDDFKGVCKDVKFPLVKAATNMLHISRR
ncbi:chitinase-like protein EN03 isoform X2 [Arctopsyche grandis]|uniref:chitinase-like protein EN03 isoform X2 n=1 Tax=Arctopsyche grandis TaxID=121162 RepID=UPI00406D96CB